MVKSEGVVGDVMAKLLGKDVRQDKAEQERKLQQKAGLSEQVRVWEDALSRVGESGTVEGGQFAGTSKADLEEWIKGALEKMQSEDYGLTQDQLATADPTDVINQGLVESMRAIDEGLSGFGEGLQTRAAEERRKQDERIAAAARKKEEGPSAAAKAGTELTNAVKNAAPQLFTQQLDDLKRQQQQQVADAAKAKEAAKQPDAIDVQGKMSGLISSSAFAFGSLGMGGGSVADRQLEEQRKTREDARAREVEERKARQELAKEAKEQGVTLKEMLDRIKQMKLFDG
jgi:hypothetical protein